MLKGTGVVCARERGLKVDHVRVIRDRPPPERSEIVPCLLIQRQGSFSPGSACVPQAAFGILPDAGFRE